MWGSWIKGVNSHFPELHRSETERFSCSTHESTLYLKLHGQAVMLWLNRDVDIGKPYERPWRGTSSSTYIRTPVSIYEEKKSGRKSSEWQRKSQTFHPSISPWNTSEIKPVLTNLNHQFSLVPPSRARPSRTAAVWLRPSWYTWQSAPRVTEKDLQLQETQPNSPNSSGVTLWLQRAPQLLLHNRGAAPVLREAEPPTQQVTKGST